MTHTNKLVLKEEIKHNIYGKKRVIAIFGNGYSAGWIWWDEYMLQSSYGIWHEPSHPCCLPSAFRHHCYRPFCLFLRKVRYLMFIVFFLSRIMS